MIFFSCKLKFLNDELVSGILVSPSFLFFKYASKNLFSSNKKFSLNKGEGNFGDSLGENGFICISLIKD